jgi:uncharacterized protein YtpQ (UPF0354 family)
MKELEEIIYYAVEKMNLTIKNGTEIYEFVEDKLNIFPVGLIPLETKEGYFFLCDGNVRDTKVYQYSLSFFEKHNEKYRSIKTEFIAGWERILLILTTDKLEPVTISQLPNPAVYGIGTKLSF